MSSSSSSSSSSSVSVDVDLTQSQMVRFEIEAGEEVIKPSSSSSSEEPAPQKSISTSSEDESPQEETKQKTSTSSTSGSAEEVQGGVIEECEVAGEVFEAKEVESNDAVQQNTSSSSSSSSEEEAGMTPMAPIDLTMSTAAPMMDVTPMEMQSVDQTQTIEMQPVEMQPMDAANGMQPMPVTEEMNPDAVKMPSKDAPPQPENVPDASIVQPTTSEPEEESRFKKRLHALRDDPNKTSCWIVVLCVLGLFFPPLMCVVFCATTGSHNHKNVGVGCAALTHAVVCCYLTFCGVITFLMLYGFCSLFLVFIPRANSKLEPFGYDLRTNSGSSTNNKPRGFYGEL